MATGSEKVMGTSESLGATTRCASEMETCATSMHDAALKVKEASFDVLQKLASNGDDDFNEVAAAFCECMTGMKTSGEELMDGCGTLRESWCEYKASIEELIQSRRLSKEGTTECIRRLQRMLEHGGTCFRCFQIFSEKLTAAVTLCKSLTQDCKKSASEKNSSASTTRWAGYSAAAAFSIAALATGFLAAAPICAGVLALGAAGAGKLTYEKSTADNTLANKFKASMENLDNSMKILNDTSEKMKGYEALSKEMTKNLETALNIQIAYQNELDEKDKKIRDLEAQVRILQTK